MGWVVLCAHTNLNILRIIQYYQKTYAYTQAFHPLYHIRRKRKKRLDSYAYFFVLLGVMRKEKIMKVKSFFEDGFMWSKVEEEKCCTICESAKAKGEVGCGANDLSEAEYWEMKAEVHFGI